MPSSQTIVILGANGFLGRYLTRHFARQDKEVVAIARRRDGWSGDGMFLEWDGLTIGPWALALEGASAVINLAGRNVNCRYNETNRRAILDSRVVSTRLVGEAIRQCKTPPAAWFNASTATIYRHAEDRPQDEWSGEPGDGFSVGIAQAWEDAFFSCPTPPATRKLALRTGIVLANEPGTVFDVLSRLTRWGLGGPMGDGHQRVSWIHMDDFLRAISFLIDTCPLEGFVNLTGPDAPTNREWMRDFRHTIGMPVGLPAQRWMLDLGARLLGTETELVLKSRWVTSHRLANSGFRWRWGHAREAISDLHGRPGMDGFFRSAGTRSIGARGWLPAAPR